MDTFRKAVRFLLRLVDSPPSADTGKNLCRAFLVVLSSEPHDPDRSRALQRLRKESTWRELATVFIRAARAIEDELSRVLERDPTLRERLETLGDAIDSVQVGERVPQEITERFWDVFLPEASGIYESWQTRVEELRRNRFVRLNRLSPDPIERPAKEILWTANALLTSPPKGESPEELHLDEKLRRQLETMDTGEQMYWYDHPVAIGVAPDKNEILYGLRGLSQMLRFEKKRATAAPDDRLDIALSVSVTHPGLHKVAKPYIESVLSRAEDVTGLDIFVFTEEDTERLIEDFLCPAARRFGFRGTDPDFFSAVFGVDGPYGRHYNFLKAISALWHVARNPAVKATFKIDLDQIFPQDRLVETLGQSAFELLSTPLWGAEGRDHEGRRVCLGMLAGALVNQADIDQGLFTPDVKPPQSPFPADRWVFPTQVPQALSTVAEMMTRYDTKDLDGKKACLSRVHVTGGTTGIRVDALRRFRPFTLSSISRAEDQAYLLSVLHEPGPPYLRYAHGSGLIMRHDKAGFAADAIRSAAAGKSVGDYERMILFSKYAEALPWPWENTHSTLQPFTGSFVSRIPITVSLLAFSLKCLADKGSLDVREYLSVGHRKLGSLLESLNEEPDRLKLAYLREREAWNGFYDILARMEEELEKGSDGARNLAHRASETIEKTRLRSG